MACSRLDRFAGDDWVAWLLFCLKAADSGRKAQNRLKSVSPFSRKFYKSQASGTQALGGAGPALVGDVCAISAGYG
jgi:hypothetical protein